MISSALRRTAHLGEAPGAIASYAEARDIPAARVVFCAAVAEAEEEGPRALLDAAGWLRGRRVLLLGVTTPTRLVASVRKAANQPSWLPPP